MTGVKRIAAAAAIVSIAASSFWLGRISAPAFPPAAVELRRSEHPVWMEVWREGELHSEWQEKHGAVYEVIDQVLRGMRPSCTALPIRTSPAAAVVRSCRPHDELPRHPRLATRPAAPSDRPF